MEDSERPIERCRIPRRRFLKGSTATLAAAALGPIAFFAGEPARADGPEFTQRYYEDRTGQWFTVSADTWHAFELVEVIAHDLSPRAEQFTVRFRGSPHAEIDEGIYAVAPPTGPYYHLHLQPAGSDGDGSYYEASFSIYRPFVAACAGAA
ncbi:MAG: twin-arginine translocation signal domain-containing protein [Deltaproteobacteria bacterium]|nr:twin-arginine translocation signal domain-containing protein [Deltaproteobacteria bacterium]MBW2421715.1 twin-arginine translocation signal domain-containing protein [Deltaproteobacteria bacterium]